ncbi:MAG TPA: Clp protease N-terminal domain-containing protein, partial [Acidimicrobiales bacterium]|nr:Clp protease N-terminal domain-containing protein [Acidimicrobiales bacterium]
ISTSLGVTKQAVHKRFSLGAPSFERFTERARVALKGARDAAKARNEGFVGTEHLLLALFNDSQALSAQVLTEAGLTRGQCEAEFAPDRSKFAAPPDQDRIPWTPKAADLLRAAVTEALAMGHNYIGTEHLLLGLFQVPEGLGCKILVGLGATEEDLRRRVVEKLKGYSSAKLTEADLPSVGDEA